MDISQHIVGSFVTFTAHLPGESHLLQEAYILKQAVAHKRGQCTRTNAYSGLFLSPSHSIAAQKIVPINSRAGQNKHRMTIWTLKFCLQTHCHNLSLLHLSPSDSSCTNYPLKVTLPHIVQISAI